MFSVEKCCDLRFESMITINVVSRMLTNQIVAVMILLSLIADFRAQKVACMDLQLPGLTQELQIPSKAGEGEFVIYRPLNFHSQRAVIEFFEP